MSSARAGRLDPQKPFFTIYHCNISRYDRRGAKIHNHLRSALGLAPDEYCNGFGFFGHGHRSNADWHFFWDRDAAFPAIECASLAYWKERGGEGDKPLFAQGFGDGTAEGGGQKMIHALLIKVYDDMINKIDKIKNAVSEQDNPVNPVQSFPLATSCSAVSGVRFTGDGVFTSMLGEWMKKNLGFVLRLF